MPINTSNAPYFDDFDEKKNFQKILYKPSFSVQARELNSMQSILHNQTKNLTNSIFKHGSRITGNIPKHLVADYITINHISPYDGNVLNFARITNGVKFKGETSGIEANLIISVPANQTDPDTLYIQYTLAGIDNTTTSFLTGEIVDVIDANNNVTYSFSVLCPTCPNSTETLEMPPMGKGVIWQIPDAIFYTKGYFVDCVPAKLVAEKYTQGIESYVVGLDIIENIVTVEDDQTLYDNALGYSNYKAPGADRYKISLIPAIRPEGGGDEFIVLAKVVNGVVIFLNDTSDYANLMDMLAERTFDESGNYTVVPFKVTLKEHLAKSKDDPLGVYTSEKGGDENKLCAIVSAGKAYVLGYQIKKISETIIDLDKSRDTMTIPKYYNNIGSLNYILVNLDTYSAGFPSDINKSTLFTGEPVYLYDDVIVGGLPTGNNIGTLMPYDIVFDSTKTVGAITTNTYKLYFVNLSLNLGKTYNQVKTLYSSGTVVFNASSVNDLIAGSPIVYNASQTCLIWDTGKKNVKTIMSIDNNTQPSLSYTYRKKLITTLNSNGSYTWTSASNEYFVNYSTIDTIVTIINADNTGSIQYSNSVISVTPTTIVVNMGIAFAGKKIEVIQNVLKTNASIKTKNLSTQVIANASLDNAGNIVVPYNDLYKVISIKAYTPSTVNDKVDVISHFNWTNGVNDISYIPIVFSQKSTAPTWAAGSLFEITFQHYTHSVTGDYFCVDSYQQLINDPTQNYSFADIPTYTSINSVKYDLKNCLDFRPAIMNSQGITAIQPALNGTYNLDVETYLPRVDLIVLDKFGNMYQKKGVSAEQPKPPKIDVSKEMSIYTVNMNAFVYSINNDVKLNFIENKRYTMRDIGAIDARLSNVEYYVSFTLQEATTASMQITDANGLNRFKNGFVVDNFQNYQAADLTNVEFKAALDRKSNILRPQYEMVHTNLKLDVINSSNYKKIGNVVMLDYITEKFIAQTLASQDISLNPYLIYNQVGNMILSPACDTWANTTTAPAMTVSVDTGIAAAEAIANSTGLLGTEYGAWSTINETLLGSETIQTDSYGDWSRHDEGWLQRVDTIGQTQVAQATTTTFSSQTTSYNMGKRITDVTLAPYMRSIEIQFYATGLLPNTRLYCFFDDVDVTQHCRPLFTLAYGTRIVSDARGNVVGSFKIPTNRFFNGQKTFRLTNTKDNSKDPNLLVTSTEAVFWGGGVNLTDQETIMNVLTPVITTAPSGLATRDVVTTVQSEPYDPVAQTFTIDADCYITDVEVFFSQVDPNDKIFCQLKDTTNGYPGGNLLSEVHLSAKECLASPDSLTPTKISFPYPVFVQAKTDYAVIVGGISPRTRIYTAKMGGYDIANSSILINQQPSLGSLFLSQNNKTWTAEQTQDLKFNLYRAKFKSQELNLLFKNKPLDNNIIITNPIETESGQADIRIHLPSQGISIGDTIKLDIGTGLTLNVIETTGTLNETQRIISSTGSALIETLSSTQNGTVDCVVKNITGYFIKGQSFSAQSVSHIINDTHLLAQYTRQGVNPPTVNSVTGIINQDFRPILNGISVELLNSPLTITKIDSINSVIVTLNSTPTVTGRTGGDISINVNKSYSMFNVSGSVTSSNSVNEWSLLGIGHSINDLFVSSDYVRQPAYKFSLGTDTYLPQPYKFADSINEQRVLQGNSSVNINFKGVTNSVYDTPVINIDTLSMICVSNIIDNNQEITFNVTPNAEGRLIPETDRVNGSASFKYVTQVINLQNPAMDLKIILDVYKQQDSDFDIYVKTTSPWDTDTIDNVSWVLITGYNKNFISKDLKDFVEIDILLSDIMPNSFGSNSFNNFRLKIVGKSKNPANPPLFKTLRAIALT